MKDAFIGGSLTLVALLITWALASVHPALPYLVAGLAFSAFYYKFMRDLLAAVKRGEVPVFNVFNQF